MYWFVFGYGVRGNANVDGIPFVYWMLAGITMWFFVNAAILEGTRSLYQKYSMVAKMNFPLSIIPSYVVMSKLYVHLVLLVIVTILFSLGGYHPTLYYVQIVYFVGLTTLFSFAVSLIASTLAVLVRDVHLIIQASLRVLFFVSPILWLPTLLSDFMKFIIKLNPFYYLANGYRASLLYNDWYIITEWQLTIYNLSLLFVLLLFGASLHYKFRNRFADFV